MVLRLCGGDGEETEVLNETGEPVRDDEGAFLVYRGGVTMLPSVAT